MRPIELRDVMQDCNLNFLIGSGMSAPYMELLGNIETLLDRLAATKVSKQVRQVVEASLYHRYFEGVIGKNLILLSDPTKSGDVFQCYATFLRTINTILLHRKSTILSKRVNLFTTNIDVFLERALDHLGLEYNDGFSGRFNPAFALSNYGKSVYRRSLHFENVSEIPVFNVIKLHGSVAWMAADANGPILYSPTLTTVEEVSKKLLPPANRIDIADNATVGRLITDAAGKRANRVTERFLESYRRLLIVNPTREKISETLFNQVYYDLLRNYSNALEKENSVLFVMGFSFNDVHIRDLTLRVADSNPTLAIIVLAHTSAAKAGYETLLQVERAKHRNIKVLDPANTVTDPAAPGAPGPCYNLAGINARLFGKALEVIETKTSATLLS